MVQNSSVVENPADTFEIYDVWYSPFWLSKWFLISVAVILIVLVFALAFFIYKKTYGKARSLPCDEKVFTELNKMRVKSMRVTNCKRAYSDLVRVIRFYLEGCHGMQVDTKTDEELVCAIKLHGFPMDAVDEAVLILNHACEAKFTIDSLSRDRYLVDLERSIEFVKSTVPQKEAQG